MAQLPAPRVPTTGLPAPLAPLAARLPAVAVRAIEAERDRAVGVPSAPIKLGQRDVLQGALATLDALAADKVTPEAVWLWVLPLAAAVANPPSEGDMKKRAAVIAGACAELPRAVFNVETQRQAMREFRFWPSVADVHALLANVAAREIGVPRLHLLMALVAPDEQPERPPPTPQEIAAVTATLERWRSTRSRTENAQ